MRAPADRAALGLTPVRGADPARIVAGGGGWARADVQRVLDRALAGVRP